MQGTCCSAHVREGRNGGFVLDESPFRGGGNTLSRTCDVTLLNVGDMHGDMFVVFLGGFFRCSPLLTRRERDSDAVEYTVNRFHPHAGSKVRSAAAPGKYCAILLISMPPVRAVTSMWSIP